MINLNNIKSKIKNTSILYDVDMKPTKFNLIAKRVHIIILFILLVTTIVGVI